MPEREPTHNQCRQTPPAVNVVNNSGKAKGMWTSFILGRLTYSLSSRSTAPTSALVKKLSVHVDADVVCCGNGMQGLSYTLLGSLSDCESVSQARGYMSTG